MTALIITSLVALGIGFVLPPRRVLWFVLGSIALFAVQFGLTAYLGFNGLPREDALLLFEGQMSIYLGFAAKTAFRTFAAPVFIFAALLIWRARP